MSPVISSVLEPEIVRTGAGRVHLQYRVDGRVVTDERCNLDDAKSRELISFDVLAEIDRSQLCELCFG